MRRNNWFVVDKRPVRAMQGFMEASKICKSCTDILQLRMLQKTPYKDSPSYIEAAMLAATFLEHLTDKQE